MEQLIAQHIESVEDEAQHPGAVARLERLREGAGRSLEPILPVRETDDPVVLLQNGLNT